MDKYISDFMAATIETATSNPIAPFGAIIVYDNEEILLKSVNNTDHNPLMHGELSVIHTLFNNGFNRDVSKLRLYSTAEPCPMCAAAIYWAMYCRRTSRFSFLMIRSLGILDHCDQAGRKHHLDSNTHTAKEFSTLLMKFFFLLIATFYLSVPKAIAGSNKVFGVSTRAQTMGGAFVGVADDAAAVYYNPAGLTQINNLNFTQDFFPLFPQATYTNGLNGVATVNRKTGLGSSAFVGKRINDHLVLGLGLVAPFARQVGYPQSNALFGYSLRVNVLQTSLMPVAAFKLTDKLSFGLGPTINYEFVSARVLGFKQRADGFTVSGLFSLLYQFSKQAKFGVTYHAPTDASIRGHGRGYYLGIPAHHSHSVMKFKNPGHLEAGLSIKPTPKLLLAASVGVEFWQQAKGVRTFYNNPLLNNTLVFNPRDTVNLHLGLEYRLNQQSALRLGYMYLPTAIPADRILPGILDFDINVGTFGYSYFYNKNWRLDLGIDHAEGNKATSRSSRYNPFVGTYQAEITTLWVGLNYQI